MTRARIVKEEILERDTNFLAILLETKNASLILLSEEEDRLGTLAVAIPQERGKLGPPLSSALLGERNMILARSLAEHLAERFNKIALVSVFAKTVSEKEAGPIFMKLMEKTIKKEGE